MAHRTSSAFCQVRTGNRWCCRRSSFAHQRLHRSESLHHQNCISNCILTVAHAAANAPQWVCIMHAKNMLQLCLLHTFRKVWVSLELPTFVPRQPLLLQVFIDDRQQSLIIRLCTDCALAHAQLCKKLPQSNFCSVGNKLAWQDSPWTTYHLCWNVLTHCCHLFSSHFC